MVVIAETVSCDSGIPLSTRYFLIRGMESDSCLYASAICADCVETPALQTTRSDLIRFLAEPVTVIDSSPFFESLYAQLNIKDETIKPIAKAVPVL